MGKDKIVVALGGNALGDTPETQLESVRFAAEAVADIAAAGNTVVVGHGNGPQVGMIHAAMEFSALEGGKTPAMPFAECGAMSQGYIGYHLQQAIDYSLKQKKQNRGAVALVTQVVVNPADPAFANPTKPIGRFMSKDEADAIAAEKGYTFVEDSGRGYRRVVPSPLPVEVVELEMVRYLIESGAVVVAVGGGGVPVVQKGDELAGVAAVIDKDRACARLADDLDFDTLLILTAVDKVYLHYNNPNQQALDTLTADKARDYIAAGHFAPGSMLPKIEACLDFVTKRPGRRAVITSLEHAAHALGGGTGTVITSEKGS